MPLEDLHSASAVIFNWDAKLVASAILIISYLILFTEKLNRAVVALVGACIMIFAGVLTQETAIAGIDFNTLALLTGMMIIVGIAEKSGMFQYVAVWAVHRTRANPRSLLFTLGLITAVFSALLDNVTTVLLIVPVTFQITEKLKVNPYPYLIMEIFASNIGGTATLIGDPPNIMIGSAAGYTFLDFIIVDAPIVCVILAVVLVVFYFLYGRGLHVPDEDRNRVLELDPKEQIEDMRLLKISVVMLVCVVIGFMCHGALGIESSVVALTAAAVIMLISRVDVPQALLHVEWTTLTFFCGLFIIVGGMVETGTIDMLANALMDFTGDDVLFTMIILLVASAVISSVLDNIPFVATMIPILLAMEGAGMDVTPLWWATSLGACLGGNGTLIGASCNVVISDIAAKNGNPISFVKYMKIGFPLMLLTVLIAGIYLYIVFQPV